MVAVALLAPGSAFSDSATLCPLAAKSHAEPAGRLAHAEVDNPLPPPVVKARDAAASLHSCDCEDATSGVACNLVLARATIQDMRPACKNMRSEALPGSGASGSEDPRRWGTREPQQKLNSSLAAVLRRRLVLLRVASGNQEGGRLKLPVQRSFKMLQACCHNSGLCASHGL